MQFCSPHSNTSHDLLNSINHCRLTDGYWPYKTWCKWPITHQQQQHRHYQTFAHPDCCWKCQWMELIEQTAGGVCARLWSTAIASKLARLALFIVSRPCGCHYIVGSTCWQVGDNCCRCSSCHCHCCNKCQPGLQFKIIGWLQLLLQQLLQSEKQTASQLLPCERLALWPELQKARPILKLNILLNILSSGQCVWEWVFFAIETTVSSGDHYRLTSSVCGRLLGSTSAASG